jgi:hypothetical protein
MDYLFPLLWNEIRHPYFGNVPVAAASSAYLDPQADTDLRATFI